ncbi:MAG: hypothetical protein NY202_02785 [Mollicutes bacterium UO1]
MNNYFAVFFPNSLVVNKGKEEKEREIKGFSLVLYFLFYTSKQTNLLKYFYYEYHF